MDQPRHGITSGNVQEEVEELVKEAKEIVDEVKREVNDLLVEMDKQMDDAERLKSLRNISAEQLQANPDLVVKLRQADEICKKDQNMRKEISKALEDALDSILQTQAEIKQLLTEIKNW